MSNEGILVLQEGMTDKPKRLGIAMNGNPNTGKHDKLETHVKVWRDFLLDLDGVNAYLPNVSTDIKLIQKKEPLMALLKIKPCISHGAA